MLGLKVASDEAWAREAAADLDRVLVDHAHCEMKAAANALSMAGRHPHDLELVRALTDLAAEEIEHFQRVLAILARRGLALGTPTVDEYAAELRRVAGATRSTSPVPALAERLIVCALIEARSCERFKLLSAALEEIGDREMSVFYTELLASEARHFRTFVDLAVRAAGGNREAVSQRLEAMGEHEGEIVRDLARETSRATVHG